MVNNEPPSGRATVRSVDSASTTDELQQMAELAAGQQSDHQTYVMYLGDTASSIVEEVGEVQRWGERSAIVELDGRMAGWLVADVDEDMGRVWWLGPFVAEPDPRRWADLADQLYHRAVALLPDGVTEQESAADDRGGKLADWCVRHRFSPNTASVLLRLDPEDLASKDLDPEDLVSKDLAPPTGGHVVRPLADADHDVVKHLHQVAFPGTHTTPDGLVTSNHPRLVLETEQSSSGVAGEGPGGVGVVGYVAYELQPDGSGYIDYLAVDQTSRGSGYGGALVAEASRRMIAEGASYVHLTVREDNPAARALYARIGFVEERVVRPYRIGFDLG
jgi:ribosomal protein S18 acetylase RimI-like enzyme